jgi:hypothetical protein
MYLGTERSKRRGRGIILGNAVVRNLRGYYLYSNFYGTAEEGDCVFWDQLFKGNEIRTLQSGQSGYVHVSKSDYSHTKYRKESHPKR